MRTKIAQSKNPQLKHYKLPSNWKCPPTKVILLNFATPDLDLVNFNAVVKLQILHSLAGGDEKLLLKLQEIAKCGPAKDLLYQIPGKFVLLIDEYDTPLNRCLYNQKQFETLSEGFYETFFNTVKDLAQKQIIQKCVITGILKFSQVGIFSGLYLSYF